MQVLQNNGKSRVVSDVDVGFCGAVVHISTWIQLVGLIGPELSETPQPAIFPL